MGRSACPYTAIGLSEVVAMQDCRLSEFLAALSLATALGLGQPMEHVVRSCLIGSRLSVAVGGGEEVRAAVCSAGLLAWMGCIADAHEAAALFGDDVRIHGRAHLVDLAGLPLAAFVTANAGAGGTPWHRLRQTATALAAGRGLLVRSIRNHCETTGTLATRLGLGPDVSVPLQQVFERWDGRGYPVGLKAGQIEVVARVVAMAGILEVFERLGGTDAAKGVARRRRGTQFDPELVDCFVVDPQRVLAGAADPVSLQALVETCPILDRRLTDSELDTALEAVADFTDLKSPSALGHSRGVAALSPPRRAEWWDSVQRMSCCCEGRGWSTISASRA